MRVRWLPWLLLSQEIELSDDPGGRGGAGSPASGEEEEEIAGVLMLVVSVGVRGLV